MEKKTQPETPANNAGSGVADDVGFSLPSDTAHRDAIELAELFRRSGWFGSMTTPQLATLIVVGEGLGLTAGQSVFDLTVTPADGDAPAAIAYRERQTCQAAGDAADALRAGNASETGNKDLADDETKPAAAKAEPKPGHCPTCDSPDPKKHPAMQFEGEVQPCKDPFHEPASNVVQIRKDPPAADNAKSDVTDPTAGDAGVQRKYIEEKLTELGHSPEDVAARLQTFDAAPTVGRATMFEDCARYYKKKIGDIRYSIIKRLADDGKTLPAQQAGFYLYADVPPDPNEWTFTQATKAAAALENFLKRK